jgi:signal transduction histidine kinase
MKRDFAAPLWFESAAAILLALFVSTVATVWLFQVEDELRTARANIDILFDRVADAAPTIEEAPPALRAELLITLARPTRQLTLDEAPMVAAGAERDAEAEARIAALVSSRSSRGPREVRVRRVLPAEAARFATPPRAGATNMTLRPVSLMISIRAGAGWLNVLYRAPESPLRYWPALLSGMVAAAVMILATLWTRARFATPLQRLTEAAIALRRGEPVRLIPEGGPPAMRAAAQSFNAMSQRLTATLENQRAIMTAVAHDLRTPIASMRLRAEFIADEEERIRLLQTLDEMQTMAEAVLSAARADRTGEAARPVDLTALAESLAEDMMEMGGEVSFDSGPAVRCVCRTNEVRRALRNLLENAMRYGKRARVSVSADKLNAMVRVEDDGPGIPPGELERVFEPFARLETSRSAQTGGYGLGLSIARWIARGHGGDITLANRPGGGLRATLILPLGG